MDAPFSTPILFLIFNRPDTTLEVFEEIRKVRPAKLYVAADGPRANRPDEVAKCLETRAVISKVDWPCEVITLFREGNLGCKRAVSSAITWFFEQVEEGIILEDDCLPSPTFFTYCATLLEHYRYDERIMHIGGDGLDNGISYGDGSYYISPFPLIWGWASWRRAWNLYDVDMASYPRFKEMDKIADIFPEVTYQKIWLSSFDDIYSGKIDSWDYQWSYAVFSNGGMALVPNCNLISNIGFREDATHTITDSHRSARPRFDIPQIVHPTFIIPDKKAIAWNMLHNFFTKPKESPLERFALYRFVRSVYGKIRSLLGLN